MLVIEGRVLAGALAPKSFQVSWVCLSFRSLYWFIWPCLNAVASSRCFFRKAWSSNSCFCLNSHESFSCCFLRVFSSFSWMIWNQRRIYLRVTTLMLDRLFYLLTLVRLVWFYKLRDLIVVHLHKSSFDTLFEIFNPWEFTFFFKNPDFHLIHNCIFMKRKHKIIISFREFMTVYKTKQKGYKCFCLDTSQLVLFKNCIITGQILVIYGATYTIIWYCYNIIGLYWQLNKWPWLFKWF